MPRLSTEGAIGIASGVLLFILDKLGIGNRWLYVVLFILALLLCIDSVVRSDWANSKRRKWLGACLVIIPFGVLGFWIFLPREDVPAGYEIIGQAKIYSPQDGWFASSQFNPDSSNVSRYTVKTEPLAKVQEYFDLMIAERINDYAIDAMKDPSLEKTKPFSIVLPSLTVDLALSKKFIDRIFPDTHREGITLTSVTSYLIAVPKGISENQIVTLSDVKPLGGYILGTLNSNVSISRQIVHEKIKPQAAQPVLP